MIEKLVAKLKVREAAPAGSNLIPLSASSLVYGDLLRVRDLPQLYAVAAISPGAARVAPPLAESVTAGDQVTVQPCCSLSGVGIADLFETP